MFKAIFATLLILLALSSTAPAVEYYIIYNTPVELGSEDDGIYIDGYWTLLRLFDIPAGQSIAVPKTASKLVWSQWNDTELQEGGFWGALAFYQVDTFEDMR